MTQQSIALAEMLMALENELRNLYVWDVEPPSAEALSSIEPFSLDRLNFAQWLQFVFIPRLRFMIENRLALPNNSDVSPMAEEYFRGFNVNSDAVILYVRNIDRLLSET